MGLKRLTPDNWLEPDPVMAAFGLLGPDGSARPLNSGDVVESFLAVGLSERVPTEVGELFEAARGAAVYGWFFYPLFALADEQLHRVADRAVAVRVEELGGPARRSLHERLRWLSDCGVIRGDETVRWDAIRALRNIGSHPTSQALQPPGHVRETLALLATCINSLWEPDGQQVASRDRAAP